MSSVASPPIVVEEGKNRLVTVEQLNSVPAMLFHTGMPIQPYHKAWNPLK